MGEIVNVFFPFEEKRNVKELLKRIWDDEIWKFPLIIARVKQGKELLKWEIWMAINDGPMGKSIFPPNPEI